uniref:Uncharacterized protein n=1 Tax=Lepeophtheirus salmonis TaxID=72036 RepID=A0A0K2U5G1_LEPSM
MDSSNLVFQSLTSSSGSLSTQKPNFNLGGRVSNPFRVSDMASSSSYTPNNKTNPQSIFDEEEDIIEESSKRASLIEEFTRDEVGASALSSKFKSSFAREVVQNVRLSMSIQSPEHLKRRKNSRRISGNSEDGSIYSSSLLNGHDLYDYRRDNEGISASLARRSKSMAPKSRRHLISDGAPSPCSSDESLAWASHRLSNVKDDSLLEGDMTISSSYCSSSLRNPSHYKNNNNTNPASLETLKKACMDLDLKLNELDWMDIRNYLLDKNQLNDNFVINDDFYHAYNYIMSNKRKLQNHHVEKKKRNPKDSMKSDSGGEMESCRSSEEEEDEDDEELADEDHEADFDSNDIQERRNILKRERELSTLARDLSKKETELLKLRVDFNIVSEERDDFRRKYESLKIKLLSNDSQIKEIEHLKWQLKTLENSRKTYESATERLMSFLEQVSLVIQATSPAHKKLIESTRAEVSAITRKTRGRSYAYHSSAHSSQQAISRAESMPSVVHDRQGESPFGKKTSCSTTSGSMCSLNSSNGNLDDHPLSVMTLGRKIKRSQSTQSKMGLPIVDEEANSLVLNSSLLSLTRNDQPPSSTPIKPHSNSLKKSELRKKKEHIQVSTSSDNNTSTDSEGAYRSYTVTSEQDICRASKKVSAFFKKEDLIREELSKQVVKPSTPLFQHSQRNNMSCEGITTVDITPTVVPSGCEETKDDLRIKAHKMLRSMKCILAREKTLNITPKRSHNLKSPKQGLHRQNLQLLSHQSSFPGLPSFPVLAVSHTSPWNC